jgi:cyclase
LGAGEIMLTSVDMEGTRRGFDLALLRAVRARVRIPVIASGGAGSVAQVAAVAKAGIADGVAVASLFHYGAVSVPAMKRSLADSGIAVRP